MDTLTRTHEETAIRLAVEKVTLSLVREYLLRKGYHETLGSLTLESGPLIDFDLYTSRRSLGRDLRLGSAMRLNKETTNPLRSMLEVVVKSFLQDQDKEIRKAEEKTRTRSAPPEAIPSPINQLIDKQTSSSQGTQTSTKTSNASKETNTSVKEVELVNSTTQTDGETHTQPRAAKAAIAILDHMVDRSRSLEIDLKVIRDPRTNSATSANTGTNTKKVSEEVDGGGPESNEETSSDTKAGGDTRNMGKLQGQAAADEVRRDPEYVGTTFEPPPPDLDAQTNNRERSPSRINSLKNSLSEDIGSDPDDPSGSGGGGSIDGCYPPQQSYPDYSSSSNAYAHANAHAHPHALPSRSPVPPSSIFTKTASRNNSSNVLIHPSSSLQESPNALETKQNLLAEATLSLEENELRQKIEAKVKLACECPEPDMTLEDIEDYEVNYHMSPPTYTVAAAPEPDQGQSPYSQFGGGDGGPSMIHFHKPQEPTINANPCVAKTLDGRTWAALKSTVFGSKGLGALEGWVGQGFTFNQKLPLGLVQRKGGPCGVLSVMQALVLKNLMFGSESEYFDEEQQHASDDRRPSSSGAASTTNVKQVNLDDNSVIASLSSKRMIALVAAIVEILWKCALVTRTHSPSNVPQVTICLAGSYSVASPAPEIFIISALDELKKYIRFNLHRFDCIGLVYSVVLTRGLERVQEDMDFPNSPLLGQHGYCTQELISLLTIGKAISNAFDNEMDVGEKILKGVTAPVDIGLLSLFEHYDSIQVGNYLKNPKFPIWIVCSESHFSVLFSNDLSVSQNPHASVKSDPSSWSISSIGTSSSRSFNLYYYDGLAHQDQLIKLSIIENGNGGEFPKRAPQLAARGPRRSTLLNNNPNFDDEDTAPPLEKCIRTKWKNAAINWNETEPIL